MRSVQGTERNDALKNFRHVTMTSVIEILDHISESFAANLKKVDGHRKPRNAAVLIRTREQTRSVDGLYESME